MLREGARLFLGRRGETETRVEKRMDNGKIDNVKSLGLVCVGG